MRANTNKGEVKGIDKPSLLSSYLDSSTVTPIKGLSVEEKSNENLWRLRAEKQRLESRRNVLSDKREKVCAELREQHRKNITELDVIK
mmetsp:Transcript_16888/g.25442  ORF Transcript_16888/g.25442 Transcript_16888/m.25442 type:complete len:88 (+) Transcript_16888:60-323(+)